MSFLENLRGRLERALFALWYPDAQAAHSDQQAMSRRLAAALLSPLACLTARVARRARASTQRLSPQSRPCVVVLGNLVVGGTGKTPATIGVARALTQRGWKVGLLAGGYRAQRTEAREVFASDDALEHGDEPVLLAQQTGLPVVAGRRRADALALLRTAHPDLDVVLSDDGLQHAALPRSVEVAVFDARGAGNGRLLPAGPLREPLDHLRAMDAVLLNATADAPPGAPRAFRFRVEPIGFRPLAGGPIVACETFAQRCEGRSVAALAGIAQPLRFFDALRAMGLRIEPHPLPDHGAADPQRIAGLRADLIVMTSKDAVKCRAIADRRCWVLETGALVEPAFIAWIEERLRGQPTA